MSTKKWYQKKRYIIPLVLVILMGIVGASSPTTTKKSETTTASQSTQKVEKETKVEAEEKKSKLNMQTFGQIKTGMSKQEVEKITGVVGSLQSETDVGGNKLEVYNYEGESILSTATITYNNNKVMSKVQVGLR